MTYSIESRTLTAQDTAVVRGSVPVARLAAWITEAHAEIHQYLTARRVRANGPLFARCAVRGDVVDVEAGFPVLEPVPGGGRIAASRLPGGPAAVTTHRGDRPDLAHRAVTDWLQAQGLRPAGPQWDVFYTAPGGSVAGRSVDVVAPYRIG